MRTRAPTQHRGASTAPTANASLKRQMKARCWRSARGGRTSWFKWLFGKWPLTQTQGLPTVGSAIRRGRAPPRPAHLWGNRPDGAPASLPREARPAGGQSHCPLQAPSPHLRSLLRSGSRVPRCDGEATTPRPRGRQQAGVPVRRPGLGRLISATVAAGCALSVPPRETWLTTRGQATG